MRDAFPNAGYMLLQFVLKDKLKKKKAIKKKS